jgi:hypothetical protein
VPRPPYRLHPEPRVARRRSSLPGLHAAPPRLGTAARAGSPAPGPGTGSAGEEEQAPLSYDLAPRSSSGKAGPRPRRCIGGAIEGKSLHWWSGRVVRGVESRLSTD